MNSAEMSLIPWEAQRIAERMLADYDAHRPNEIFAERRKDWITLDDAYAVQRAVAELRLKRGERCLGYKVGCLSAAIQNQLGLHEPVRGYLWQSEALLSGSHLPCESPGSGQECRFVNLAIEGQIALRLIRDIAADIAGVVAWEGRTKFEEGRHRPDRFARTTDSYWQKLLHRSCV